MNRPENLPMDWRALTRRHPSAFLLAAQRTSIPWLYQPDGSRTGDILPITPLARVLVMLEQFAGIGYLAVMVSRPIGMTLVQQRDTETS